MSTESTTFGNMGDPYRLHRNNGSSSSWNKSAETFDINGIVKNRVSDSLNVIDYEQALEGQLIIWNSIFAFALSMALKAAILLDIPDILAMAGPEATLSLEQIAAKLSSKAPNIDILRRILRFLALNKIVSLKVVETSTGVKEYFYGLTSASSWLVKEKNECCLAPMALMQLDKVSQAPWHVFNECIMEGGTNAFERANGKDIWSFANEFPDFNNLFNKAMVAESKISISAILRHYDGFKDLKSLVDVGGGLGQTSSKIVSSYPHIKCINFDLPHVINTTASSIPGVEHVSGDMFESVPSADAIIMKWILHDWDDERCVKILRNCYSALPDKGKVIIVDVVLDLSEKMSPYANLRFAFDLVMIAHASGGMERSREEWHNLLTISGFPDYKIFTMPNLQYIIEAYKT